MTWRRFRVTGLLGTALLPPWIHPVRDSPAGDDRMNEAERARGARAG